MVVASPPPLTALAAEKFPTRLWVDSGDPREVAEALEVGAVGVTCNPTLALRAFDGDRARWMPRLRDLAQQDDGHDELAIAFTAIQDLTKELAGMLHPAFDESNGRDGRVSIQVDPRIHGDTDAIVTQAERFAALAPNIVVKIPATSAGIKAIEEVTFRGVSINATVSFTVSQAVAVAEAVEAGIVRRTRVGLPTEGLSSVCTIMGGRLDDHLKSEAVANDLVLSPGVLDYSGVAVMKRVYEIFTERRYQTRLLSAAFRNHLQWCELQGGDLVVSPPLAWIHRINRSTLEPIRLIDRAIDPKILDELSRSFPSFETAYQERGTDPEAIDLFPPVRATLRAFLDAGDGLARLVRDAALPAI